MLSEVTGSCKDIFKRTILIENNWIWLSGPDFILLLSLYVEGENRDSLALVNNHNKDDKIETQTPLSAPMITSYPILWLAWAVCLAVYYRVQC